MGRTALLTIYNLPVDLPKIAVIGAGNMGRALVGGLLGRGVPADSIHVGESIHVGQRDVDSDHVGE